MLQTINKLKIWTWHPFTKDNLDSVPHKSGVYCLGLNDEIIYIGSSNDLNERLTDHYYSSDPCISKAEQFAIEPCTNYKEREREHLLGFKRRQGRLPICNDKV